MEPANQIAPQGTGMYEQAGHFKSTRWTTVLRAGQPDEPGAGPALDRLCEDYHAPLHEFARVWLKSPEDAEDLTQAFFCHFIERNLPGSAGRERGRFRTFLIACFKNFLRDHLRRGKRAREIPAELLVSLNADNPDSPSPDPGVEPAMDRQMGSLWAGSIRHRVITALARDYRDRGKGALFGRLRCLLNGRKPDQPYAELAAELGVSEAALKMEVLRLRERFRKLFREEVAQTVADPAEVEPECRYLLSVLFSAEEAA
jgi:RNA polymerase sigma factor (sigma-70 family)